MDSNTRITTLKLLINSGANINAVNDDGRTALYFLTNSYSQPSICPQCKTQIIVAAQVLLTAGMDKYVKDRKGTMAKDLLNTKAKGLADVIDSF